MPLTTLSARGSPIADPLVQIRRLGEVHLERELEDDLAAAGLQPLRPTWIDTLQVNVGRLCNMTCRHCHVDAGPDRREAMSRETFEACLVALRKSSIPTVDITGGAPELNPHFRWFVREVRALGRHVIDRCNLTILEVPAQRDLAAFLAEHRVEIVASLPHYRKPLTDTQRGDGVFERSISALRRLNALGYGDGHSGLSLHLVTNPVGAFLPGSQASLEREWKRELLRLHGVRFDGLYAITNMPISRYLEWLVETGNLDAYMERLVAAFNPAAARGVMCRNTLSVGWDGRLHDCDFNQMLDMGVEATAPAHVRDFDLAALTRRRILTGRHCYGCTAGAGSSCGGATAGDRRPTAAPGPSPALEAAT
jgi:radical SAM/Cys-rich protein